MPAAIITTVLADAIGGTQTVALDAGRLRVVTGATGATAPVISAQLVLAVGLAGLEAAAPMTPRNRVRAGPTRGSTTIVTADLADASTGRALALKAVRVATADPAGDAAPIRTAGVPVAVGLAKTLALQADVLIVRALAAQAATSIVTAELSLAVWRADL